MTQPNVSAYMWDDLTVGPKRLITGSGKFYLTLTNACGVRTDTFKIMIDTVPERRLAKLLLEHSLRAWGLASGWGMYKPPTARLELRFTSKSETKT